MTNAWHLRNDGKAFPVYVHVYPMQDADLASEAEVASFIISTDSKDQEYAGYVLDAFIAMKIENAIEYDADEAGIENAIIDAIEHLPYKFAYPLDLNQIIKIHRSQNNFSDVDSLYEFVDEVRSNLTSIQNTIKDSFNQQFCRVRYGGKFNTIKGNNCIWFRIASVGYNWDNVIYKFTSDIKNQYDVQYITICRDPESDGSDYDEEYFYKAKDGTAYYYMPIHEFFTEEHENNPVFSSSNTCSGVINTIRKELKKGNTFLGVYDVLASQCLNHVRNYRPSLLNAEIKTSYIEASEWFDALNTRTKLKLSKVKSAIKEDYPEILDLDIDFLPRENRNGNPVGFELLFKLVSNHPKIDNVEISIVSSKSLASTMADRLTYMFKKEYDDFINFRNIRL